MICPENHWGSDWFWKFIDYQERFEAFVSGVDDLSKIDRPILRAKIMSAMLEQIIPAGRA